MRLMPLISTVLMFSISGPLFAQEWKRRQPLFRHSGRLQSGPKNPYGEGEDLPSRPKVGNGCGKSNNNNALRTLLRSRCSVRRLAWFG